MASEYETEKGPIAAGEKVSSDNDVVTGYYPSLDNIEKGRWERLWPSLAAGAGLFSDGFLQGVIGPANTMLKTLYPKDYTTHQSSVISAIAFAGTVVGQLAFGYTSDHYSRKWSLLISTVILIIFAILSAGAWGAGGSISGLFSALTAYRFLVGIGIGGEYPAGSVSCAESSGELKAGTRNRWFIIFTNIQIDLGFVVSSLVAMIVVLITGPNNLGTAWRVSLGIGAIPPLSLFYLRLKLQEPEQFKRQTMRNTRTPYGLVLRFYWWRLIVVALIWFLYDFSAYSFTLYSSTWISTLIGDDAPYWQSFGYSAAVNCFYLPGAIAGAFLSDLIGPRLCLAVGVLAQGIIGFLMAGIYPHLSQPQNVGGFIVIFGIFLSLGELGPGDNIGLVASKTCATPIRGQYYGIAAATGKIGGFVGTYVYPIIIANAPGGSSSIASYQNPVYVSSALCIFSAFLAFFCLPKINQDTIEGEDERFRAYLESKGYDTSQMGIKTQ